MTNLIVPKDGPRVHPRLPEHAGASVNAEYEKARITWGIPNNLVRTMGCHPALAQTEVDYANSFIFDEGGYAVTPRPGGLPGETVLFPTAGFVDRVTKELVISLVSLLNRSRYSITHHTGIGYATLSVLVAGDSPEAKAARAEQMLLQLVDAAGRATFDGARYEGEPLYSELQTQALRVAEKTDVDAHSVTDGEMNELRNLLRSAAVPQIAAGPLARQFGGGPPDDAYIEAYVDGMMVELTWNVVHFSGLLNRWFTLLKVCDEEFPVGPNGESFIDVYNATVPESIKVRNNALLGPTGWGR